MIAPETRSGAMVVISSTVPAGTILAYLITSICSFFGAGWETPYEIAAAVGFIACAAFLLIVRKAMAVAVPEDGVSDPTAEGQAAGSAVQLPGRAILALLLSSGALFFLIPVLFHGMLKDGVMTWVPSILQDTYGTSDSLSTLLTILLPIVNLFGSFLAHFLFLRVFRRHHALTGAVLMLAAALPTVLLLRTSQLPLAAGVVCLSLLSMLMTAFNYVFSTLLPAAFAYCHRASTVSGVFNATIYAGSALSTYGFAEIAEHFSWSATILLWLGLTLISTVLLCLLIRPWRRFLVHLEREQLAANEKNI